MNWSKGYTSATYVREVDPDTWRDLDRLEITGGSVNRSEGDLQEAASLDCKDFGSGEKWVRVWMDTAQEGAAAHVALFTGLATSPENDINGRLSSSPVVCYSVLKPAADVLLPRGWYAPAGASGAALIAELLSVGPAPIETAENSPILSTAYVAESGETNLTMVRKILAAIDWRIRISGEGVISIEPKPTEPVATFDCLEYDSIEPELTVSFDWYECPNVFRATRSGVSAVARDESDGIFSIPSRGREIWAEEDNVTLNANETLQGYAARRLGELQQVTRTAIYDRRYHPDVNVGDLIRLHYPKQGIDGIYRPTSQDIDLAGGRTSEEADEV